MLCYNCSLKNVCRECCQDVKQYLKSMRNYKTTYVNEECVQCTSGVEDVEGYRNWMDDQVTNPVELRSAQFKKYLPLITDVINHKLTQIQQTIAKLYFFDGLGTSDIGKVLNQAPQNIHQVIYGHPSQGGGIIRKIQKNLVKAYPELSELYEKPNQIHKTT